MGASAFYETAALACAAACAAAFAAAQRELGPFLDQADWWRPYPERDHYRGDWQMVPLIGGGGRNEKALALVPRTAALLASVPDLRQALYSSLAPGTVILPHRGMAGILRVALVLQADPGQSGWRVDGRERACVEGQVTIFEDGAQHEAWNRGRRARVALLFDTIAPDLDPATRAQRLSAYDAELVGAQVARGGARAPIVAPRGSQAMIDPGVSWDQLAGTAEAFVEALRSGDTGALRSGLDPTVSDALPDEKALGLWSTLEAQVGRLKERQGSRTLRELGHRCVYLRCAFDNATLEIKMVFGATGRIIGFTFLPVAAASAPSR